MKNLEGKIAVNCKCIGKICLRSSINGRRIDKIACESEAEEMRAGQFCNTCNLLEKVNDASSLV